MKKLRWQFVILLLTGLVVGVLLISQQPSVTTQSTTSTPTKGGIYTEALVGSLKRLNPFLDQYNPVDNDVDHLLYSSLIRFDSRGLPEGDLVESWGISKDGTQYNFSLRPNLTWHDGQAVTADDILFTVDLLKSTASYIPDDTRAFWKDIQVVRLSDTLVQFRLPEPFAPFLDYLTFGILPKHLLSSTSPDQLTDSPFNLKPVGSGPYRFDHLLVENNQIVGVVLTAYSNYYRSKPFIDQVVFRYYPDSESAFSAYQAGEVQGLGSVSQETLPDVLADPNLMLYTGRLPRITMVYLNLNNQDVPFFSDPILRRALLQGVNRKWIIDNVLNGQAIQANGPILPGNWAYYDGLEQLPFDLESAQKSLAEVGYTLKAGTNELDTKDGVTVKFQLIFPDDATHQAIAESIQKSWATLGISVDLQAMPYDQLITDQLDQRVYQAALVDINLSTSPDPDPYPFWDQAQATGGQNYSQWNDKNASEFLEQARITTDITERTRLYRNFQVIFQKAMPALPLFYPVYTYAIDRQVLGVQMGPMYVPGDRFSTITSWFLSGKNLPASTRVPSSTIPSTTATP
jgi:peptide/nickel transport system substrate-binding protein